MTFETIDDYHNLLNRYLNFSVLVDETIEVLEVAVNNKMTNHLHSMVSYANHYYLADTPVNEVHTKSKTTIVTNLFCFHFPGGCC